MAKDKDERNVKILSLLIVNSLLLQKVDSCRRDAGGDGISEMVVTFVSNIVAMHGDGKALYQDAHDLARELGFELEVATFNASQAGHA